MSTESESSSSIELTVWRSSPLRGCAFAFGVSCSSPSREDRGQMLARSYLTSETGKVYTMLAHAAGRFD